ncbi:MAG TPA: DUF167 domain-containing protein [Nitrospiraceae bacterium]|nr:DUF167 domain-containing protein [Nitrospiraceae bacterium]
MNLSVVRDTKNGALLTVYVRPSARVTECTGVYGDALKIRIAAPPADGAANSELVRFLARRCSIPLSSVHIQSGFGSKLKRILLKGIPAGRVIAGLNLEPKKDG